MKKICYCCGEPLPPTAHEAKLYCSIRCRKKSERQRARGREQTETRNRDSALHKDLFAHLRGPSLLLLEQIELEMLKQNKPMLVENPPAGWIPQRATEVTRQNDGSFYVQRWEPTASERLAGITMRTTAASPIDVVIPANSTNKTINPITQKPLGAMNNPRNVGNGLVEPGDSKAPKGGPL